jgi:nucleoside recognition membrane protein YjiH
MWQRKQILWLLLSGLITLLTFFIPYGVQSVTDSTTQVTNELDLSARTSLIIGVLTILIALSSFGCIFLYKNRSLQMKLIWLIIALCIGCAVYIFYDANLSHEQKKLVIGLLGDKLYLGILVPIASMALLILAFMGIRADERLIKSMDRLR